MKGFDPGQMRHRVQFMMPVSGRDDLGGPTHTWLTSNEIWAKMEFTTAGSDEQDIIERVQSMVEATATMYFRDGVFPKMRLKYDNMEFNILTKIEDPMRQYMTLELIQDEPYQDYYVTDPDNGFWLDFNGNRIVAIDNSGGGDYRKVGDLTWTAPSGSTWVQS